MIELEWHEYDTTAEMADAVACDVADVIESALELVPERSSRCPAERRQFRLSSGSPLHTSSGTE